MCSRRIIHPSGTVELDNGLGSIPVYHYHLTDHLGNVRAVIKPGSNNEAILVQSNDYYPFGMVHSTAPATNLYFYNGKEAQKEMNGKWYDYGARFYDAQLGRWHTVDPMAERHFNISAYNYALNNPLLYIDPFGLDTVNVNSNAEVKSGDVVITENGPITVNSNEAVVSAENPNKQDGLNLVTEKDAGTNNESRSADGESVNIDGLLPNVGVKSGPRILEYLRDAFNTFFNISSMVSNNNNTPDVSNISKEASNTNPMSTSPPVIDSSRSVMLYWHDDKNGNSGSWSTTLRDSTKNANILKRANKRVVKKNNF